MDNTLDPRAIAVLTDVLDKTRGSTDGLNVKRYRIDHAKDLEVIDQLVNRHLLVLDPQHETMRVGPVGVVFVDTPTRRALVSDLDRVLDYLRDQYRANLEAPVLLARIAEALNLDRSRIEECMVYLRHGFSISISGDLHGPKAYATPSESLLRFDKIRPFLAKRARSWMPDAFEKKPNDKPHGNTVANASKREQVLGAAIAAIIHWPDQCRRGDTFNGHHIATLIDENAQIWWLDGEAPLSVDTMTRLINSWCKLPE